MQTRANTRGVDLRAANAPMVPIASIIISPSLAETFYQPVRFNAATNQAICFNGA